MSCIKNFLKQNPLAEEEVEESNPGLSVSMIYQHHPPRLNTFQLLLVSGLYSKDKFFY